MTNQEIKDKIKGLQKAIEATTDENRKKMYQDGISKLESKLEKESDIKPTVKTKKARKAKVKSISRKSKPVKTHGHVPQPKPQPKKKVIITKKDIETKEVPVKKTLIIKKKQKEEKHVIDTAFGKDIEGAILSLNKARFIVREQKNRKTGEVETVKHSQEYRNSRAIQNKVDRMFNSSIADIAEKDKTKKKEIENLAKELRDIHVLWLNEIDIIISNGEIDDMKNIKKMLIGLLKEARKNDEDNKWRNAAKLGSLAKKYNL